MVQSFHPISGIRSAPNEWSAFRSWKVFICMSCLIKDMNSRWGEKNRGSRGVFSKPEIPPATGEEEGDDVQLSN